MAADCKSAAPRSYEGSNPSLCTTGLRGTARVLVAVAILAAVGALVWATMDAGKTRDAVWVLLAGFALRIVLLGRRL